jgi:hypothetical protein
MRTFVLPLLTTSNKELRTETAQANLFIEEDIFYPESGGTVLLRNVTNVFRQNRTSESRSKNPKIVYGSLRKSEIL